MISEVSESDVINKENTKNSDDSYSDVLFSWFPSRTRRKSRLGTYRKDRIKILEDVSNTIETETPSSESISNSDFKVLSLSPRSGGLSSNFNFEIPCVSSTSLKLHSNFDSLISSISPTFPKFSNYDFGVPNVSPKSLNFDSIVTNVSSTSKQGSNSDLLIPNLSLSPDFKIPCISPPPACIKCFSPLNSLQQSISTNLRSSSKKSSKEKPVIDNKPELRDPSSRKEVRFTEHTPLLKNVTGKSMEERPAFMVNGKMYQVKCKLDNGGSSVVYEVFHPIDPLMNDTLAMKRVLLPKDEELQYIAEGYLKEIQILKKLQTHNKVIIKMFDYELVDSDENGDRVLYVVLEKGDMCFKKYMCRLSEQGKLHAYDILHCWRRILMAVSVIHDEDIMHLDLKPSNFLVVKGEFKLIDFGISHSISDDKTSITLNATCGTINYTSPETLMMRETSSGSMGYRVSKASDVWSLGCILYKMIYNYVPFYKPCNNYKHEWERWQQERQRWNDITSPDKEVEFPERADIPESLFRSLKLCLQKDPKKRPTVKDLLYQVDYYPFNEPDYCN